MGKSEKRALMSQIARRLMHLLTWDFQPERRSRSWRLTIADAQTKVLRLLDDNPSLKATLPELMAAAYIDACRGAAIEAELDLEIFPQVCPYLYEDAITFQP